MLSKCKVFDIPDDHVVMKNQNIRLLKRGAEVILLDPETGMWDILDEREMRLLNQLSMPRIWGDIVRGREYYEVSGMKALLGRIYKKGLLHLGGTCFHRVKEQNEASGKLVIMQIVESNKFKEGDPHLSERRMDVSLGKKILSMVLNDFPDNSFQVYFTGGETLAFSRELLALARYGIEEAAKMKKNIRFAAQTRGGISDEDTCHSLTLKDLEIHWMINGAREGTHGIIQSLESELEVMEKHRSRGMSIIPVISLSDPHDFADVLEMLVKSGFRALKVDFQRFSSIGRCADEAQRLKNLEEYAMIMLSSLQEAFTVVKRMRIPVFLYDFSQRIDQIVKGEKRNPCFHSPCGLGRETISFSIDGNIYACGCDPFDEGYDIPVGSMESVPNLRKYLECNTGLLKLRDRTVESIPRCRRCLWKRFCSGGCVKRALYAYDQIHREDPLCRYFQLFYENLLWELGKNPHIVNFLGRGEQ